MSTLQEDMEQFNEQLDELKLELWSAMEPKLQRLMRGIEDICSSAATLLGPALVEDDA